MQILNGINQRVQEVVHRLRYSTPSTTMSSQVEVPEYVIIDYFVD